jgi:NADH dehydrogenase [ubiquinone] 1 alpha subcomplex assembly factor 7
MTAADRLLARIAADGPISVADYMAECLLHPANSAITPPAIRSGAAGDFITAPEISQMFGELIGLALAQAGWIRARRPACVLAELGPGRGTLMADALRATARVPAFHAAGGASGRGIAQAARGPEIHARGHEVVWVDGVGQLPEAPLFLVANEFFDALPIRQFQRDGPGWREIRIGVETGRLAFGLAQRQAPQPALAHRLDDTAHGDMVEHCPALPAICESSVPASPSMAARR